MYIFKLGFISIAKNKLQSLIKLLLLILIFTSISICVVLISRANAINDDVKEHYQSEVLLQPDFEAVRSGEIDPLEIIQPDLETRINLGESDFVKSTDMNVKMSAYSDQVIVSNIPESKLLNRSIAHNDYLLHSPEFNVIGYDNDDLKTLFEESNIVLLEGRIILADNEVLVSKQAALANDLGVGSVLSIGSLYTDTKIDVEIVGIYDFIDDSKVSHEQVLTTFDTVTNNFDFKHLNVSTSYTLRDAKYYEDFIEEAQEQGVSRGYKVGFDQVEYSKVSDPIKAISGEVIKFLITIWVFSLFLMLLLLYICTQKRKSQFKIFKLMGMPNYYISFIFVIESLILYTIAFLISLVFVKMCSQYVGDLLLANYNQSNFNFIMEEASNIIPIIPRTVKIVITFEAVLKSFILCALLSILTIFPIVIRIFNYNLVKLFWEDKRD